MSNDHFSHSREYVTPEPSQDYFVDAKQPLNDLLNIVGLEQVSDAKTAYEAFSHWAQGDHARPHNPLRLDGTRATQAHELYDKLGMVSERPLPTGDYDEVIVLGGIHQSNKRRVDYLARQLESKNIQLRAGGRIVVWAGERAMFPEKEADLVARDIDTLKQKNAAAWAENAQDYSETIMARLALSTEAKLGNVALKRLHLRLNDSNPLSYYEFLGEYPLMLLHTKADERSLGAPRHSTETCTVDWLKTFQPRQDARVAFISSNPFIDRTARVVRRALSEQGREDITILAGGPAVIPETEDSVFLGEIARNLYEDIQAKSV